MRVWAGVLVGIVAVCESCKGSPPPVDPAVEAEGHYLAATTAYLKSDFKEAHAQFDEVRRLNPTDQRLPAAEGELLMSEQRIDEAIASFEAATKLEPKRSTNWSRLGALYGIKGQTDKAKSALDKALELNPKDFNAHESMADLLLAREARDEALAHYLSASEAAPAPLQAELVLKAATELVKSKQSARALEVLEAARTRGVSTPALHQELGDRYVEAARWDDAIAAYTVAASGDPSAWELVAELELRQKRFEKAAAAWNKAIEAKDLAHYHVGLGRICLARKNKGCAEKELELALSRATGEEVREALGLADLLARLGRKSDALKLLESVSAEEEQRTNEELQRTTARLARELGNDELVKTACSRVPSVKCP